MLVSRRHVTTDRNRDRHERWTESIKLCLQTSRSIPPLVCISYRPGSGHAGRPRPPRQVGNTPPGSARLYTPAECILLAATSDRSQRNTPGWTEAGSLISQNKTEPITRQEYQR